MRGGLRGGELSSRPTQQLAQVLVVEARPEQAGVRVGGLLYGGTLGDGGTRVVVGRGGWRHLLLHRGLVVLPDEGGDVEAPEGFLVRGPGGRYQLVLLSAGAAGWAGQICNDKSVSHQSWYVSIPGQDHETKI